MAVRYDIWGQHTQFAGTLKVSGTLSKDVHCLAKSPSVGRRQASAVMTVSGLAS